MSVFDNTDAVRASLTPAAEHGFDVLTQNEPGVAASLLPGRADPHNAIVLLANLGPAGRALVAAPTTKRRVCDAVLDSAGDFVSGGCVDGFTTDRPIAPNIAFSRPDQPAWIYGLASDDVTAVSVTVNGDEHQAMLANNAFYLDLPAAAGDLGAVRISATLTDASPVTIDLPSPVLRG